MPALLLASCAMVVGLATSACTPRVVVKTDFCTPWRAIFASRQDVLTDGTVKAIKAHDETGVKLGCWPAPPPRKSAPKK